MYAVNRDEMVIGSTLQYPDESPGGDLLIIGDNYLAATKHGTVIGLLFVLISSGASSVFSGLRQCGEIEDLA